MNVSFDIDDKSKEKSLLEDIAKEKCFSEIENHIKLYIKHLQRLTHSFDGSMNTCDPDFSPFNIDTLTVENVSSTYLIDTENQSLRRVILAFTVLCEEADRLISDANCRFFTPLLLFEIKEFRSPSSTVTLEMQGGHILNLLHDLRCFVIRVETVCVNIYSQLRGLYSETANSKNRKKYNAMNVHFQIVIEKFASLLTIPVTLNKILKSSVVLRMSLEAIDKMLKSSPTHEEQFGVSEENKQLIKRLLSELTNFFFKQPLFDRIISSICRIEGSRIPEVEHRIETAILTILSSNQEVNNGHVYVCAAVLFVLHSRISFGVDKKLLAELISTNEKVVAVELVGHVVWTLGEFLDIYCPKYTQFTDKKLLARFKTHTTEWLGRILPQLDRIVNSMQKKIVTWSARFKFSPTAYTDTSLIPQAINNLFTIRKTVVLLLHFKNNLFEETGNITPLIGRLVCLIKFVQHFIFSHKLYFIQFMLLSTESTMQRFVKLIGDLKTIISRNPAKASSKDDHIDVLSCINLLLAISNGPVTSRRLIVIRLALNGCRKLNVKGVDFDTIESILSRVELYYNMFSLVRKLSDCGFLLWYGSCLPDMFFRGSDNSSHVLDQSFYNNQCMLTAFRDIVRVSAFYPSIDHSEFSSELLCNKLFSIVEKNSLSVLSSLIEQELRCASYLHLRLDDSFKSSFIHDWRAVLDSDIQMIFPDGAMSLKGHVAQYLDSTFYNFTAIALHDSPVYQRMRAIGSFKYNFEPINSQLPRHALDQGIDVLNLIREIGEFVVNYCYNLNNQFFVQKNSPNKHLITIGIDQISNSIRTHGNGIINTTVNFIYQFLRGKLFLFSQFLYDSHIKSRLFKEIKYCDENNTKNDLKYPFNRAERFNSEIRQLGMEVGQTYLDRFRSLISHIGNALALVRLIRSGAMRIAGCSVKFMPNLNYTVSFSDLISDYGLSDDVIDAAKNLDGVLSALIERAPGHNEYFKILADVFTVEFRSSKHSHLADFYMILPSLTLNYVEYLVCCKEKINRKEIEDAVFSDDGFAIGLVFILTVLDQYRKFDSLHWFTSVSEYYAAQIAKESANRATRQETNLQKAMSLTLKRLETFKQEYSLLDFSMSSARIFFGNN